MIVLNKFLYVINIITLFALTLSYFAPISNPNSFLWPLAFLGLIYPILLIINLIFCLYWLSLFKKYFWSNLFIILIGFNQINSFINLNKTKENVNAEFSIMSFNVRLFNEYKWINKPNIKNKIIDFINSEKPNILCLQEFYAPIELPQINMKFNHIGLQSKKKEWRMATYSDFPIINKGTVSIYGEKKNNVCIFSDIIIDLDTFRIYNIHLASNWFNLKDYSFLEEPLSNSELFKENFLNIIKRLKKSFSKRAIQADVISKHINKSPYPIILCGDFNDTPHSYTYRKLTKNLKDSFLKKGFGLGKTYNVRFLKMNLPLRIDYIFTSNEITIANYETKKIKISDHYPIKVNIN